MEQTASRARGIRAGIGCALILCLGTGCTTVINAMVPDIIAGTNATMTVFMIGPALATAGAFLGSLVATKAIDKLTPKWSLLLGTITVSIMLAAIGMATNVVVWIVANVMNGIVMSFGAHAAASGVISRFFGDKTQSAYGVVAGVYSVLNALEVFLVAYLLGVTDYRTVFFIFAGLSLVLGCFANFVLIGKVPAAATDSSVKQEKKETSFDIGFTLKQVLKTPSFYLFGLVIFLGAWSLSAIGTFSTIFFTDNGVTTADSAVLYGVHNTVGAIIMLFAGVITNKFSARTTAVTVFGCFIAGIALLLAWGATGQIALAFLGMAATSTILMVAIMPSLFIPDLFGMKEYTSINAAVMATYFLGHTVVMVGLAGIAEAVGINAAFLITAGLGAVALACMLVAYAMRPMKKLNGEREVKLEEAPAAQ